MTAGNYIDHAGFISAVRNGKAYVTIIQTSACASCSVKESCGVKDSEHNHVEIPVPPDQWHVGDEVIVRLKTTTGFLALFLGYMIPFVLVVVTLLVLLRAGFSEGRAGLISLMVLPLYYVLLSRVRRHIQKRVSFNLLRR